MRLLKRISLQGYQFALVFALILIAQTQLTWAANPCLGDPDSPDYPTEQILTFHVETKSEENGSATRTIRVSRNGSNKPEAELKVSAREGEEFKLSLSVVPILSTIKETNEVVASLGVIASKVSPKTANVRAEKLSAKIEDHLTVWRHRLSLKQKNELDKYGILELTTKIKNTDIIGIREQQPSSVSFTVPIKHHLDLYDIAKELESRVERYKKLSRKYNRFGLSDIKDGLTSLEKIDEQLNLFWPEPAAIFEEAVQLQKMVTLAEMVRSDFESELRKEQAKRIKIQEEKAPAVYVNVKKRKWSHRKKNGYEDLEETLLRVINVDKNLYQSLLSNFNEVQDRLYKKNLKRLDWLKTKKQKNEDKSKLNREIALKEIDQKTSKVLKNAEDSRSNFLTLKGKKVIHFAKINKYIALLKNNIEDKSPPAEINLSGTDSEVENSLYDALDWGTNQQAYLQNERARLDQELGQKMIQWKTLDRQLAVSTRSIAENRQTAACRMSKALSRDENGRTLDFLSEFNDSVGEFKDAVDLTSESAEKHVYARRVFVDLTPDVIEKLGEKMGLLSEAAGKIESWSGPVENLLQLNQQLKDNNPMFLVTVLEGSGAIAEKVPVIGSTLKRFLDYHVYMSTKIIKRGQLIHSALVKQAVSFTIQGNNKMQPQKHLYSAEEVRDIITTRLNNVTDKEVQEIATSFQAERIKYLLTHGVPVR